MQPHIFENDTISPETGFRRKAAGGTAHLISSSSQILSTPLPNSKGKMPDFVPSQPVTKPKNGASSPRYSCHFPKDFHSIITPISDKSIIFSAKTSIFFHPREDAESLDICIGCKRMDVNGYMIKGSGEISKEKTREREEKTSAGGIGGELASKQNEIGMRAERKQKESVERGWKMKAGRCPNKRAGR
ncbi:hypothetical protein QWJ34_16320 [Saccharibacillus sp. CPCC 101409]|uniref:hypothetical protein n=1 Tax=Saccharibacillus sp. CPCC 101409 TaxID=3058041 RepID=UPI0026725AFE|nr:hypothetical protein [Saccharibacillus sp. CPCC 101409]MDO3411332.1 hypothetical protein [Saccharibacillus sp. CPCC 101409]